MFLVDLPECTVYELSPLPCVKLLTIISPNQVHLLYRRAGDPALPPFPSLQCVEREVDRDAGKVGLQRRVSPKGIDRTVEADKDLLANIFALRTRSEHTTDGGGYNRLVPLHETPEGSFVPLPDLINQFPIVAIMSGRLANTFLSSRVIARVGEPITCNFLLACNLDSCDDLSIPFFICLLRGPMFRRNFPTLPILALLLLSTAASTLTGQSREAQIDELFEYLYGEEELGDNRDMVREGVREKMRLSPAELAAFLSVELPEEFVEEMEVIESRRSGADFQETAISASSDNESELHAAINPTDSNNIVVGVINFNLVSRGQATTNIYSTHDFGKTWRKSQTLFRTTGFNNVTGGGDPMFAFAGDGTLYYSWIDLTIDNQFRIKNSTSWAFSKDGGITWERATNEAIGDGVLTNGGSRGEMFDKQWMVVDQTGGERDGRLYTGLVHSFRGSAQSGGMGIRVKVEGTDEVVDATAFVPGNDWGVTQLASPVVDPEGNLHMLFFGAKRQNNGDIGLWLSSSVDGGVTMLPAKRITDIQVPVFSTGQGSERITGFRGERTQPSSHLSVDLSEGEHKGNLYAVWSGNGIEQKGTSRNDIYFMRSTDRGATWDTPMIVNDDGDDETGRGPIDQFHPSISVNKRGIITVTWYDRREDPANRLTHYYMAHSFDGGQSFTKNFRVSSEATNFATVGSGNNGFGIGEYVQTVSTNHYAIPVWSDGRKGNGDIDIYVAFVPIGETSSVVERVSTLSSGVSMTDLRPVPMTSNGSIALSLEERTEGKIDLIDMTGNMVVNLFEGVLEEGEVVLPIDVSGVANGDYIVRVETGIGSTSRGVVILR